MKIEQLRQFQSIVRTGSINRAAKELFLSQSTLSQSLQNLEKEVGHPLFLRTGKGIELTTFGCEFLDLARSVNSQMDLIESYCRDSRESSQRTLSVACQYMRFAHTVFRELCEKYREDRWHFSFLECSFLDAVDHCASQETELGLVTVSQVQKKLARQMLKNRGLEFQPIAEFPAAVTVGPKNPFYDASSGEISLQQLVSFPIVLYTGTQYDYVAGAEELHLSDMKHCVYVSDRATMHEFLRETDAFSIAAYTGAYEKTSYYEHIRALKLVDPPLRMEVGWLVSQSRPLSQLAEEYKEAVERLLR